MEKPEAVRHPAHYGGEDNPREAVKVIEAQGLGWGFAVGNALKYLLRLGKYVGGQEVAHLHVQDTPFRVPVVILREVHPPHRPGSHLERPDPTLDVAYRFGFLDLGDFDLASPDRWRWDFWRTLARRTPPPAPPPEVPPEVPRG